MYKFLEAMLKVAEEVGSVVTVNMSEWIHDHDRILIGGVTERGEKFTLELEIVKK